METPFPGSSTPPLVQHVWFSAVPLILTENGPDVSPIFSEILPDVSFEMFENEDACFYETSAESAHHTTHQNLPVSAPDTGGKTSTTL